MPEKEKYPCCVCEEPLCLGSDCPAIKNPEKYQKLLETKLNNEIPQIEEEN